LCGVSCWTRRTADAADAAAQADKDRLVEKRAVVINQLKVIGFIAHAADSSALRDPVRKFFRKNRDNKKMADLVQDLWVEFSNPTDPTVPYRRASDPSLPKNTPWAWQPPTASDSAAVDEPTAPRSPPRSPALAGTAEEALGSAPMNLSEQAALFQDVEQPLVGILMDADPPPEPVESLHAMLGRLQEESTTNPYAPRATRSRRNA
jgi:hypothetical protein